MTVHEEFEDWWKLPKPAEVDFYRAEFEDCFKAGRESMREKAAALCDAEYKNWSKVNQGLMAAAAYQCATAIKELP